MTMTGQQEHIAIANPEFDGRVQEAVGAVIESGHLAAGPEVERFESEFATHCGATHGIGTSNGTTALHAALEGLGIGPGDEVLTTPFTFIATANAIAMTGADPVFADIDASTYNLDPAAVKSRLAADDGSIAAILVVHLYGLPAEMDTLCDIASANDVPLVEDAAQAHGAHFDGEHVGAIGDVGCFSFYPTKNMTTGEGGMVVTDNPTLAANVRQYIDHGRSDRYRHEVLGHNFRMTDLAAAIGRVQLAELAEKVATRRANARALKEGLTHCDVVLPSEPTQCRHSYNQFTIRSSERDALIAHLDGKGVGADIYYPLPVHEQPVYERIDCSAPVSERAADEVLSLPVHPQLSAEDVDRIIAAVEAFTGH